MCSVFFFREIFVLIFKISFEMSKKYLTIRRNEIMLYNMYMFISCYVLLYNILTGKDDTSAQLAQAIDATEVSSRLEKEHFVAIRLESGSEAYRNFAQICILLYHSLTFSFIHVHHYTIIIYLVLCVCVYIV